MPRFWIDIENSSGTKLGVIDQPIEYSITRRLNRAGEFAFTAAATDPDVSTIYPITSSNVKRVAVCRAMIDGTETEIGSGVVDSAQVNWNANGPAVLNVRGDDLLRELTYRSVHDLVNSESSTDSADKVWEQATGAYSDLTNAYDGNAGTYNTIQLQASGEYLLVGYAEPFEAVNITLDSNVNNNTATIGYGYSTSSGFVELDITSDTCTSGGAPFAQSGVLSFERPVGWQRTTINGAGPYYWVRWDPDATLDSIDLAEVTVDIQVATTDDLSNIMDDAPGTWALDTTTWYGSTANGTYFAFSNETVLQALVRTATISGEHFRYGTGRKVQWLQDDEPDSGVRCVPVASQGKLGDNASIGYIVSLDDMQDTYDYITRIYPKGAGFGTTQADLTYADLSMPTGYTLTTSPNGGYIKNDTADAAQQIEAVVSFKDIGSTDNKAIFDNALANQLATAALSELRKRDAPAEFYSVVTSNLQTIVLPGETVHIEYVRIRSGETVRTIDDNFVVLESTVNIDVDGVATTAMKLGSVSRWPVSDADAVLDVVADNKIGQQHAQPISDDGR